MNKYLLLLLSLLLSGLSLQGLHAQQTSMGYLRLGSRPITSSIELQLGSSAVRNTYLAPLLYSGPALGVGYERMRRHEGLQVLGFHSLDGQFAMGEDRGHHSSNWSGRIRYRYAALYMLDLYFLALQAGPSIGMDLGFDYNLKLASSNNPATAHLTGAAGLQLLATVPYRAFGRHALVSLGIHTPLVGYALMPEYGASYYETFYLEHTHGLHHFTSLHNRQDLDLRLTNDLPLHRHRGGALRLGLGYRIETMKLNQVTTRYSAFEAIVGWTFQSFPTKFSPTGITYESY